MGSVAIGPGDIYAGVGGDVDSYAGWFSAGMERDGHGEAIVSYQSSVKSKTKNNDNAEMLSKQRKRRENPEISERKKGEEDYGVQDFGSRVEQQPEEGKGLPWGQSLGCSRKLQVVSSVRWP